MKHRLSCRKHLLAFVLAAAFALCTAVPVLAMKNSILDDIDLNYKQEIDVTAVHDAPTYSIELTWGDMEFHYQYGTGWDYEHDHTFNQITVQNASFVPVAVKFEFTGNGGHTGYFNTDHKGNGDTYKALYLSEATQTNFPNSAMYLILDNKNPEQSNVGNITITMVDVLSKDVAQLISDCNGAENIGYVTSASELVPFNQRS